MSFYSNLNLKKINVNKMLYVKDISYFKDFNYFIITKKILFVGTRCARYSFYSYHLFIINSNSRFLLSTHGSINL